MGSCLRGDLRSDREVLVLGDSHAAMLNYSFDHIGKEFDFKARVISARNCVTIPGYDFQRIARRWARQPCRNQIREASHYLPTVTTIFLVGKWSIHMKSHGFRVAFNQFLEDHQEPSVYVMSQLPKFNVNISRAYRFESLGFAINPSIDFTYNEANQRIEAMVSRHSNAEILYLNKSQVFEDGLWYEQKPIHFDSHHLNEFGSKAYAKDALNHFKPLFLAK